MKVRVLPDGSVELDVGSNGESAAAAALIHQLQNDAKAEAAQVVDARLYQATASLTPKQRKLYEVLTDFDTEIGCHISGLAALLETTEGAMSHQLSLLMRLGLVYRVTRGHYRLVNLPHREES